MGENSTHVVLPCLMKTEMETTDSGPGDHPGRIGPDESGIAALFSISVSMTPTVRALRLCELERMPRGTKCRFLAFSPDSTSLAVAGECATHVRPCALG